jgi:prepilin-type processing-associated H-X9-DG protein
LENQGVALNTVTDGLSVTILAGEKHVPLGQFGVGWLDSSAYNGEYPSCYTRGAGEGVGLAQALDDPGWKFGSYHLAVCQFVFCDGHVEAIFRGISPDILFLLTKRDDGEVIPTY